MKPKENWREPEKPRREAKAFSHKRRKSEIALRLPEFGLSPFLLRRILISQISFNETGLFVLFFRDSPFFRILL